MKHLVATSILSLCFVVSSAHGQGPARMIPDDNLGYPILITLKSGTGSGFYINAKTATYLVTAKHVLFDDNTGKLREASFDLLSYSKDPSDPTPNVFTVDATKLDQKDVRPHVSEDVAVIKLFARDANAPNRLTPLPGVTIHTIAKEGIVGVSEDNLKRFADVLIANDVMIFGYPTSLALQMAPQIDIHRPLLRKGIVAGQNPQTHAIILDCAVYFGNSGGPIVEFDQKGLGKELKVIGVVSQYIPYADGGRTFMIMANSGYSLATPMDYVLDLIK